MARYIDVSQNPGKRSRLGTLTLILSVLILVLPLTYGLLSKYPGASGLNLFQDSELKTSQQDSDSHCFTATQDAENKNSLGMRSLHLQRQINWCNTDGQVTNVKVDSLTVAAIGNWDVSTPEVTKKERGKGELTIEVAQEANLTSLISQGASTTATYTLRTDGRIEEGL